MIRGFLAGVLFTLGLFSLLYLGGVGETHPPMVTIVRVNEGEKGTTEQIAHEQTVQITQREAPIIPITPIAQKTAPLRRGGESNNKRVVRRSAIEEAAVFETHVVIPPLRSGEGTGLVEDTTPFKTESLLASGFDLKGQLNDKYYEDLRAAQLELCGELCTTDGAGKQSEQGRYMETITSPVHCARLYATDFFEASSPHWPPPATIPQPLMHDYALGGYVKIKFPKEILAQKYSGGLALASQWTQGLVNDMIQNVTTGRMEGNYGKANVHAIQRSVQLAGWKGKNVLVIGSENPWAEAILLSEGVGHVYTLEYGAINSTHPQLSTFTPHEFNRLYREGRLPRFQGMATFSSLEHSGLGRYGDVLNPWGDVVQMAKTWCVLDPGAVVAVGVEGRVKTIKGRAGVLRHDGLTWNLHRKYGLTRFPLLFSNFETFQYMVNTTQPLFLAKRIGDKVR